MAREYNPRVPEVRQQATLEPAIRSAPLQSYTEKRRDYVAQPFSDAGLQWGQLARALSKWEPALEMYIEKDRKDTWATVREYQMRETDLSRRIADITRENPDLLPDSPLAHQAWESSRLERF